MKKTILVRDKKIQSILKETYTKRLNNICHGENKAASLQKGGKQHSMIKMEILKTGIYI